jgi:hypothetical protein
LKGVPPMKTKSHYLAFSLLLAAILLLSMAGCSGGNSDFKNISVQDFGTRVQESLPNLKSFETELAMDFDMQGAAADKSMSVKMSITGTGATDLTAKKTRTDMSMQITGKNGTDNIDEKSRIAAYIIEDISYIGTSDNGSEMTWRHETASSTIWEEQPQTAQLMKLLDNSKINSLKTETVQGVRCFLLELNPDPAMLWDTLMSQVGESSGGFSSEEMGNSLKKATVKYWFTQDTLFFKKVYISLDMELDAKTMGVESGQMQYLIVMTQTFNKHNQKTEIQLPVEATKN